MTKKTAFATSLLLLFIFAMAQASADCGSLPSDYAVYSDSKLEVKKNARVNGFAINGSGNALLPDGRRVSPSPSPALPDLDPASFPNFSGGGDLKIEKNQSGSTGDGTYKEIKVEERGSFSFTTVGGSYYIEKLKVGKHANLIMAPGIYFIEEFELEESAELNISPSGEVRIYSNKKVEFKKNTTVNDTGSITGLQIYGYQDVDIKIGQGSNVTGLLYSPFDKSKIEIDKNANFHGMAIAGDEVKIGQGARLRFDAADQAEVAALSTCQTTTPSVAKAFAFNCVVSGGDALSGRLYTQIIGQSFSFDVVALRDTDTDGTADDIETEYALDSDREVTLELIDTSGSGSCAVSPGLVPAVSRNLTFSAADQGRKNSNAITLSKAYRSLGCRITDNSGTTSVTACSTDIFAIRPVALTVSAPVLTNAGPFGTPTAVAGVGFSLQTDAAARYDGVPSIDASVPLLVHTGAVRAGNLTGLFAAADPATGTAFGNNFIYDEVGSFRFQPLAVIDTGFTSVDQPSDCTADYSNIPNGAGKIGCKFGNSLVSDWIGRFTPGHFTVFVDSPGALANTCPAGGFSYSGQRIEYAFGQEPRLTITAWNGLATPGVTMNYTGARNHLNLGGIIMPAISDDGSRPGVDNINNVGLVWNLGVASLSDNGNGTIGFGLSGDGFTYQRNANDLVAPFISDVDLEITTLTDDDGIGAIAMPLVFTPTGVQVRYGRLALQNAHGSELQNLRVPLKSEYYDGLAHGFVSNSDDSCTQGLTVSLSDLDSSDDLLVSTGVGRETDVFADASVAGGYAASDLSDASLLFTQPTTGGEFNLNLRAPGEGNTGSAGVFVDAPSWLEFDWQGSGMSDPAAKATFGIFRRSNSIIYLREAR